MWARGNRVTSSYHHPWPILFHLYPTAYPTPIPDKCTSSVNVSYASLRDRLLKKLTLFFTITIIRSKKKSP